MTPEEDLNEQISTLTIVATRWQRLQQRQNVITIRKSDFTVAFNIKKI